MRVLSTFLVLLFSTFSWAVVDHVEVQLQIAKHQDGTKKIEVNFDEHHKWHYLKFEVDWFNYAKDLHETGFHLTRAYRGYIDFPDMYDCRAVDFGGILYSPQRVEKSYVYFRLSGDGCLRVIDNLKEVDPSLAYYGVPFLQPYNETVNALRLTFFN